MLWQNGTPQSMHRAACTSRLPTDSGSSISL